MTDTRASVTALGLFVAALALTACTAGDGDAAAPASPSASSSAPAAQTPSVTPSPTQAYAVPTDDAGQVGLAEAVNDEGLPSGASTVGPELIAPGDELVIAGQCIGDSADWTLTTATPDTERRVLLEGTLDCADPETIREVFPSGYEGVVQLQFVDTNDVDRAWLQATLA